MALEEERELRIENCKLQIECSGDDFPPFAIFNLQFPIRTFQFFVLCR